MDAAQDLVQLGGIGYADEHAAMQKTHTPPKPCRQEWLSRGKKQMYAALDGGIKILASLSLPTQCDSSVSMQNYDAAHAQRLCFNFKLRHYFIAPVC